MLVGGTVVGVAAAIVGGITAVAGTVVLVGFVTATAATTAEGVVARLVSTPGTVGVRVGTTPLALRATLRMTHPITRVTSPP